MPQLDPTWFASQLFWLAVTFAILYGIISRKVLPPLLEILERRQQTVELDVSTAQAFKSEADQARQGYERALAEARGRAQQLMADALADVKAKGEQKTHDLDKQIEANLKDASRKIAAKKEEMIASLTPAAMELTVMIVEKLTQRAPGSEQVDIAMGKLAKGRR